MKQVHRSRALYGLRWLLMGTAVTALSCQVLSGLDELKDGQGASSVGGAAGQGAGGEAGQGAGGEGQGGEGEGGEAGAGAGTGFPDGQYSCTGCSQPCPLGPCYPHTNNPQPPDHQKCDSECVSVNNITVCQSYCDGGEDPLGCDQIEQAAPGEWTVCGPPWLNVPCNIICIGDNCGSEILCPWFSTQPCTITCDGPGSCAGRSVICGPGACTLNCVNGGCEGIQEFACGDLNECNSGCP